MEKGNYTYSFFLVLVGWFSYSWWNQGGWMAFWGILAFIVWNIIFCFAVESAIGEEKCFKYITFFYVVLFGMITNYFYSISHWRNFEPDPSRAISSLVVAILIFIFGVLTLISLILFIVTAIGDSDRQSREIQSEIENLKK